jgi:hypothetical protein
MDHVIAAWGTGRPEPSLAWTTSRLFDKDCVATSCPLPEMMPNV